MWSTLMQIVNKYMLWNFIISYSPDDLYYYQGHLRISNWKFKVFVASLGNIIFKHPSQALVISLKLLLELQSNQDITTPQVVLPATCPPSTTPDINLSPWQSEPIEDQFSCHVPLLEELHGTGRGHHQLPVFPPRPAEPIECPPSCQAALPELKG